MTACAAAYRATCAINCVSTDYIKIGAISTLASQSALKSMRVGSLIISSSFEQVLIHDHSSLNIIKLFNKIR